MASPLRIISGGQTGADRGALDAALTMGVPHGGFCPQGRRAEDGIIPARYDLQETTSRDYAVRTERNLITADATLIVCRGSLTGGTALTARLARKHQKPLLRVDLADLPLDHLDPAHRHAVLATHARAVHAWLARHRVATLNVAGPRESHCRGIGADTRDLLIAVLR